jgi:repressor of nif and glnA expression
MQHPQKPDNRLCKNNELEAQILEALSEKPWLSSQQIYDKINCKYKIRTVRYHLKKMMIENRIKTGHKLSNMLITMYAIKEEKT